MANISLILAMGLPNLIEFHSFCALTAFAMVAQKLAPNASGASATKPAIDAPRSKPTKRLFYSFCKKSKDFHVFRRSFCLDVTER